MKLYRVTRYSPEGNVMWTRWSDKKNIWGSTKGDIDGWGAPGYAVLEQAEVTDDAITKVATHERSRGDD